MYGRAMGGKDRHRSAREKANDLPALRPGARHVQVAISHSTDTEYVWPGVVVDWRQTDGEWVAVRQTTYFLEL